VVFCRSLVVSHKSNVDGVFGGLVLALRKDETKRGHFGKGLLVEGELVVFEEFEHATVRDHGSEFVEE
jgi:hypothetical protein